MNHPIFDRMPVDAPITGQFGSLYEDGRGGYFQHRGIDFECPEGTPVVAPAPGVVVPFSNDGSFGVGVCLSHDPWHSLYAHLSQRLVNDYQVVERGQVIGFTGNTGKSSGPHLHWQVCDSSSFPTDISRSRDPLEFFKDEEADVLLSQRVERLEKLMGANGVCPSGVTVDDFGNMTTIPTLFGEAAMQWMESQGFSMHLGFAKQEAIIRRKLLGQML